MRGSVTSYPEVESSPGSERQQLGSARSLGGYSWRQKSNNYPMSAHPPVKSSLSKTQLLLASYTLLFSAQQIILIIK